MYYGVFIELFYRFVPPISCCRSLACSEIVWFSSPSYALGPVCLYTPHHIYPPSWILRRLGYGCFPLSCCLRCVAWLKRQSNHLGLLLSLLGASPCTFGDLRLCLPHPSRCGTRLRGSTHHCAWKMAAPASLSASTESCSGSGAFIYSPVCSF